MALDFLTPLHPDILDFVNNLSSQHLGSKVVFHTKDDFPNIKKIKIAIVGVLENRGDAKANGLVNLDFIRKELYTLYPGNWNESIADLGDLLSGENITDTYFALHKVASFLLKNNVITIIIGGSQDLTYPLYRSYDNLEQMVNLVAIDSKFDFGNDEKKLSVNSYLTKIISDEPNNLFNYSNIGYQSYYNSQEEIDLIEKMFFDAYRLGEISNTISVAEPVLREADLVTLDLKSIKSSDSGNNIDFVPNGFSGKEICSLSRYAGISDKVSSIGIFNHNNTQQESALISQIIWYFIEGIHFRAKEYPFSSKDNYTKYIVPIDNDEIIFYKSDKSDRWWMEIKNNITGNNKNHKSSLISCSYEEYVLATNQEIPERWWKTLKKHN